MWSGMFKQIFNPKNCKLIRKKVKDHNLFTTQWNTFPFGIHSANLSQKSTSIVENDQLCNVVHTRQAEAKRSILVQVQSSNSYRELYAYCNVIGSVKNMFHYTSGVEPFHFILIEFRSEDDVKNILSSSCYLDDVGIPVGSPFLWFRVCPAKKSLKLPKTNKLNVVNGCGVLPTEILMDRLKKCDDISEQMQVLYDNTKLNDLGTRLRFLTARQVELAVLGMFPEAMAYPFGSSINGYGKMGCDLDLILKLDRNKNFNDSRLVYQCKEGFGTERAQSQRHMEAIGDLLQLFLPGCSQVRRILQARVPILKYNQQFTGIECDLSMTNMTAFHMSELLYLFGSIDPRVRPLIFTIRKWAQEIGLTNSSPGRWITNFSLTLLVLAFLQRSHQSILPILPSVNHLHKLAHNSSKLSDNLSHCAFYIPGNKLPKTTNNCSLQELLVQFFNHYSNFDFVTRAISLNEATDILKPEHSALYIVNPLENGLNVSKNVSVEELEKLRLEFRSALWLLEAENVKTEKWGILSLFHDKNDEKLKKIIVNSKQQNRLLEVSNLFEESNENVEFKNENVKKQIEDIKEETRSRISEMNQRVTTRRRIRRR